MKKLLFYVLLILLLNAINIYADEISVSVNGKTVDFEDSTPQIINGRTFVPLRKIGNALGAKIHWNEKTEEITATLNSDKILMKINSDQVKINNNYCKMDCTPIVINSRTFIPAKYLAESLGFCVDWDNRSKKIIIYDGNFVKINFIDVGQGDCIAVTDDNHCMVIDGGTEEYKNTVIDYLKKLGISKIDFVIATHNHSDHIGGLGAIISSFKINNIMLSDVAGTSKAYENLLTAVDNSDARILIPWLNDEYSLGNSKFTVIGPLNNDEKELNNNSIAIKLCYGNNSAVLCGDAEFDEESDILSSGIDISADILKISHHGSSGSTGDKFLNTVNPSIAVISVGKDNAYGHPTSQTLNKLKNCSVYRTDLHGNVVVNLTGNSVFVTTSVPIL